ncbi:sphinganine C4-monooxygenase 2-like [Dioscorea cayenensis subsp. rotundata]|uniref:aldehyde oxygenase (deformylating) n=1 Tax=Dioscorea cayennensis subsp. rotundata TaxID=55577 RepID=A0AB40C011_DIOCR|nr:sphinganine C4-monooxygenase 2-like [Dioscorea cayenensis subsp. rotundata]
MEISEEMLSTLVPPVVYWVVSGIYALLAIYLNEYRLHPKGDAETNNSVSRTTVIKGVLIQQAMQMVVVYMATKIRAKEGLAAKEQQPSLPVMAVQWVIAMIVLDTWQYFTHRYIHINRFLYKHIHAVHHAQIVPYVYGALYGHPLESLIVDIIGGTLAYLISGMTTRTSIYFFSFSLIKTLDLHSGLCIPWNPLQAFFFNDCAFHDTHHQLKGHRYNFSQPFFISWDKILGTYMPYSVEKRTGGGLELKLLKDA